MKWLDIATGEVRAKQDQASRRRREREDDPAGQRERRVGAALRFVIRPEVERWRAGGGRERSVAERETSDGVPVLLVKGRHGRLEFQGRPGRGTVSIHRTGDAEQELVADLVSPVYVRELLRGLDHGD